MSLLVMVLAVYSINLVEEKAPDIDNFFKSVPLLRVLSQYANIMVVTTLGLIIPKVLEVFITLEKWDFRETEITQMIFRNLAIKLTFLVAFLASEYGKLIKVDNQSLQFYLKLGSSSPFNSQKTCIYDNIGTKLYQLVLSDLFSILAIEFVFGVGRKFIHWIFQRETQWR